MQYMLLIYSNESQMQSATPGDIQQMMAAYGSYSAALKNAGVMVGGDRLQPSTAATTVRVANGKNTVLNGP